MESAKLKAIIEGILFASGNDGVTIKQLTKIINLSKQTVELLIEELEYDYKHPMKGIMIMKSDGVYHLTTKPEHSHYFQRLLATPQTTKLSQAALETLAIIAYRQPITRVEIEDVRGVNSDRSVQTLLAKSLIEEVGRKDAVGRPILFGTNKGFLTYFGLTSLEELPNLPENIDSHNLEREADLFLNQLKEPDHIS